MASSVYSNSLCSVEIVGLLENDDPVSDLSGESEDSEPDFSGNHCDSHSDSENDKENLSDACNITQTHSIQWQNVDDFYVPNKFMFSSVCGAKKSATSSSEAFLLFFDDEMLEMIVAETNRYADQKIRSQSWKPCSRVNSWVPVDKNEIYVYLGLIMLMGIVQKPSIKACFSKNPILDTPVFSQTMSQDCFELVSKFMHFVDSTTQNTFFGPKKLFKIHSITDYLHNKFQPIYIPTQNIAIDKSLTLWKGRLPFRIYLPLKSSKFGIITFELCESNTGYLW
jgi:hypothetical protein